MKKRILSIISLLILISLFAVSCGNDANTSTNPTPTPKRFFFSHWFLNNGNDKIEVSTADDVSPIKKDVLIRLSINPNDVTCNAKISAVSASNPALEPSDFTLSKTSGITTDYEMTISLSSTGIQKIKTASKGVPIEYTITLELETSSDQTENKITSRDINISVLALSQS
ncbi:MBG domain-containing protein [Brachyspira pulli]|uniref:MBG domain-containing protein n=1 Tax=Brachyspira pulli TaxID=310721 RepID=UPI003005B519